MNEIMAHEVGDARSFLIALTLEKTTTLYAAAELVQTAHEKIITVENPVEYQLAGVPQVPVNENVGVTFATALRTLLG